MIKSLLEKSLVSIVLCLARQTAAQGSFEYDYCSIGHSLEVYEDVANNFNEVFGGYSVPMDPSMCPFHPVNLAYLREN